MKLSCEQVAALMPFYSENKLSEKMMKFVREHIEKCPYCRNKYFKIKSIINDIIADDENKYQTKQYEDFKTNLSAYIDNELDDFENIKVKKFAISNPLARQDLENIYSYKKLLHNSYEKTKNEFKTDFSKSTINFLLEENKNNHTDFYNLVAGFSAVITLIVAGMIYFLYF